ncbi:MAG: leucyl aminopeptidase [Turneriella sp.]|nr:leucyl aminopeptidase [Leptospiraceae bacterium]MCX7631941.1 leucyl aminopeptidase [Turneriella sp.]
MAQKKKATAAKKSLDFLVYPEKIRCRVVGSTDDKKQFVRFVTQEEQKDTKEAPEFFKAEAGETGTLARGYLVGLGKAAELNIDLFADTVAAALNKAATRLVDYQIIVSPATLEKIGLRHALRLLAVAQSTAEYPTDFLKGPAKRRQITAKSTEIVVPQNSLKIAEEILDTALTEAYHTNAMRQTQALPANYITPQSMDQRAADIARRYKLRYQSFGRAELERMGAGGILAVSQGSAREPRFIVVEYNPPKARKTLALVGKGVTFDTGGISLKPANDMHEMKFDMSGSAMALHALAAIAELKLPIRVVCAVAMVENMPSGTAFKPGDVFTALNGKTVEVQNTDAEGRLILADALCYVQRHYRTDLIIDMATLTGACVIALGDFYAGLFSNHPQARALVEKASAESLEPVWPLPVGKRYRKLLKSDIADINNVGGRAGGACSAAEFLRFFIEEDRQWVHLDIAGIAMIKKPFSVYTASGSGYGVRLLCEVARQMLAQE